MIEFETVVVQKFEFEALNFCLSFH